MDINEVFDQILLSEERIAEEGFKQGFEKGVSEGNLEAYHLGEFTAHYQCAILMFLRFLRVP